MPKYQDLFNFVLKNFFYLTSLRESKSSSLSLFSVKTEIRLDLCAKPLYIHLFIKTPNPSQQNWASGLKYNQQAPFRLP